MGCDRESTDILKLFSDKAYLKICAPMVRYSKVQFRCLVREYGCDIAYTPMILADSFCLSEKARNNEFTTNSNDSPLIAQFAANTVHDFVGAAYLISPFCDGVGLNCGCPQRWAKQLGLGCCMLQNPELISTIIKECRNTISKPFTVSVKMRILNDLKKTVDVCRQLEKAGASYLSIHARTPNQLTGDINVDALKLIVENVNCPVVANGGVKNSTECDELHDKTNCKGVMVANGILTNPTIFSDSNQTTMHCVQKWLDICYNSTLNTFPNPNHSFSMDEKPQNLTFQCFHHHLVFMLEKILPKWKRRIFNNLQKFADVFKFLEDEFKMTPALFDEEKFKRNAILCLNYGNREEVYRKLKEEHCLENVICNENAYVEENSKGKYFSTKVDSVCESEDEGDLNDIFVDT